MTSESYSVQQLRALVAVAETHSFTLAGERLGLSQPAVSALIKRLEADVGQTLIARSRGIRVTAAGRLLAESAARSLRLMDDAIDECRSQASLKRGCVRLAVGHLSAAFLLPRILKAFQQQHPDLDVQVVDVPVDKLKARLVAQEADLAIGAEGRLDDSELLVEPLLRDRLALFVQSSHPLARSKIVNAEHLNRLPVVQLNTTAMVWRNIDRELIAANIYPRVAHHVTLYSTAIGLVMAGMGVALLPSFAAAQLPAEVIAVPIVRPELYWPISAVRLAKYPLSPTAMAFMAVLRAEVQLREGPDVRASGGRRA